MRYRKMYKIKMCHLAGTSNETGREKTKTTTPPHTDRRTTCTPKSKNTRDSEESPVLSHFIQRKARKDPKSRCNLSADRCKKSRTYMKMPEEVLFRMECSVNFIVNKVFGRFVMELNLADPNFADFRSNSANRMYFG